MSLATPSRRAGLSVAGRRRDAVMVGCWTLMIGFTVVGGLGIIFNVTVAALVGSAGCAASWLFAYLRAKSSSR